MNLNNKEININDYSESIVVSIPKFSNVIDIDLNIDGANKRLNIYYTSLNNDEEQKNIFLKLIKIDDTIRLDKFIGDYEFFKTITASKINATSYNNISIEYELIKTSYLVFINQNFSIDEIREQTLNKIMDN